MEITKQQLYEKKDMPKGFYPKDAIVFKITSTGDDYFDTDFTFEECLAAVKAGVNFIIQLKYNNEYRIYTADEIYNYNPLDSEKLYDESVCVVTSNIDTDKILHKEYFIYKKDDSKIAETRAIISSNQILDIIELTGTIQALINGNPVKATQELVKIFPGLDFISITWQLGHINTIGQYYNAKVYIDSPGGWVTFTWFEGNGFTISNKINILSFSGDNNAGIRYYKHDIIDLGQANSLYRASPMNIEPITNPKIWVGNATQYAAIAEKDPNTTYIVKSE